MQQTTKNDAFAACATNKLRDLRGTVQSLLCDPPPFIPSPAPRRPKSTRNFPAENKINLMHLAHIRKMQKADTAAAGGVVQSRNPKYEDVPSRYSSQASWTLSASKRNKANAPPGGNYLVPRRQHSQTTRLRLRNAQDSGRGSILKKRVLSDPERYTNFLKLLKKMFSWLTTLLLVPVVDLTQRTRWTPNSKPKQTEYLRAFSKTDPLYPIRKTSSASECASVASSSRPSTSKHSSRSACETTSAKDYVKRNEENAKYARKSAGNARESARLRKIESLPRTQTGEMPEYLLERREEWEAAKQKAVLYAEAAKIPKGFQLIDESERIRILEELTKVRQQKENEMFHLPVRSDTMRIRNKRESLETELSKLDEQIELLGKPKVLIPMSDGSDTETNATENTSRSRDAKFRNHKRSN